MSLELESVESLYPFVLTEDQEHLRREIRRDSLRHGRRFLPPTLLDVRPLQLAEGAPRLADLNSPGPLADHEAGDDDDPGGDGLGGVRRDAALADPGDRGGRQRCAAAEVGCDVVRAGDVRAHRHPERHGEP